MFLHDVFFAFFHVHFLFRISDDMIKRFGWLVTVAARGQGFAHELGMTAGWILFWDNGDNVVWA